DAVVGFQTTALLEAAAAGRPVVYAAWGALYETVRSLLIPFDEYRGVVTHASGPGELSALLSAGPERLPRPSAEASEIIGEHLGPVDGKASARTVAVLRRLQGERAPTATQASRATGARALPKA